MSDNGPDILLAVTLAQKAERFLSAELSATGTGLGEKLRSVEAELRRLSPGFLTSLKQFTTVRNKLVHEGSISQILREDFNLVCQKLELEINYYTQKLRSARGVGSNDSSQLEKKESDLQSPSPLLNRPRTPQPQEELPAFIEAEVVEQNTIEDVFMSGNEIMPFGIKPAAQFLTVCSQGLGEFQTLQAALNAAREGDKIYILPGVYRERLRIEKSVEIVGQGEAPEDVVIESEDDVVYLQASGAAIRACCFRTLAPGRFCLVAANAKPASITLCNFKSPDGTGIVVVDGARLMVEECSFEGCKLGVRVDAAYAAIVGNKFDSNYNAILVRVGCESVIERNEFTNNEVSAVQLFDDTSARISQNRFRGGAAGIVIANTSKGSIQGNHFFGHSEQSAIVSMGGPANVLIRENTYD